MPSSETPARVAKTVLMTLRIHADTSFPYDLTLRVKNEISCMSTIWSRVSPRALVSMRERGNWIGRSAPYFVGATKRRRSLDSWNLYLHLFPICYDPLGVFRARIGGITDAGFRVQSENSCSNTSLACPSYLLSCSSKHGTCGRRAVEMAVARCRG